MRYSTVVLVIGLGGCASLPQSLPPEKFRTEVQKGAYGWAQTTKTTTTREYQYGQPTGRTFTTTTRQ